MNLEEMTLAELKDHHRKVAKAIETYETRQLAHARRELEKHAKELGVSLDKVVKGSTSKGKVQVPKYQHPNDPNLTWTGKGRRPEWYLQAREEGYSEDALKI